MAERRRGRGNPYRPGTSSHAAFRRSELNRRLALAEGRAARATSPETRHRALRQAAVARRGLRQIPELEAIAEYRGTLNEPERRIFDSLPLAEKARELKVEQLFPEGVPADIPDPYAEPARFRSAHWRLMYATRAGFRHRRAR
jgi:hypothetical protein